MTTGTPRPRVNATTVAAALEDAARLLATLTNRAQDTAETRLPASQMQALEIIERAGRINVNGLAAQLGSIPSSASRLCDRLQAADLIARTASTTNRREVLLVLTKAGQSLLTRVSRNRRALLVDAVRAMDPAARHALLTGLEALTHPPQTREGELA